MTSTRNIAAKPSALAAITNAVPKIAIATPPMAGETMRVACHMIELSATALTIWSCSMSCGKKALRAGQSTP